MIETYRGVVYPNQIDHIGHMNVQWYVAKFDEATWHFLSNLGITSTYIRENNKGMVAVEQKIRYKEEVLSGDLLAIKSRILKMEEKSVHFLHVMFNVENDRELASCELVGVHLDRKTRKSCSFPKKIYEKGKLLRNDNFM